MPLSTEAELQDAYRGEQVASRYVSTRFLCESNRLLHERQVAAAQRLLDAIGSGAALEIAPGPGRITRDVRPRGRLVCLEYNEGMLAEGRAACSPSVEWIQGNAFDLPFGAEFDLVWTFRFIRHFHASDRYRLYDEVRSALRPGGWFLMDAVNETQSLPLRKARPEDYPIHDELYREETLRNELRKAGFDVVDLRPVQKFHRAQHLCDVYVGPRWKGLNRALVRGLEALPRRSSLEWIVTCRRA